MNDISLEDYFHKAKMCVDARGYRPEYEYQQSIIGKRWSETDFLREYSWVVFCCGFREQVVRKWFSYISMVFFDFVSAREILKHKAECRDLVLSAINNEAKVNGIIETVTRMEKGGFAKFRENIIREPATYLVTLPYIGEITCNHLLKNLGFDVAKNDRHLQRICYLFKFEDATTLCKHVSELTGEPTAVVDIILWRYAVLASQSNDQAAVDMR